MHFYSSNICNEAQNLYVLCIILFRNDFATVKDDLAFREDEIEKSKHTLEGLTGQHNQVINIIFIYHRESSYLLKTLKSNYSDSKLSIWY